MKLHVPMSVISVSDLTGGELIQLTKSEQSVLGFVVTNSDGGQNQVLLLQPILNARPFHTLVNLPREIVVSYGKDWVLEPVVTQETSLNNHRTFGVNGVLRMTANDLVWEASDPTGYSDGLFYSLNNNAKAEIDLQSSLPFTKWKIWASDNHRKAEGAHPLMEFDANSKATDS
ncbi:hypothetical protein [Agrobacterium burrii]|uniref:Uncharacterized protein n=1 Tax=Agrobacterium burrii TaxID=2815339 RepID=A0ABS3EDB0_9HYPH|nr:hypothetical protein [Agrobacterium burrii]MBO0129947.1 hypothetical protein [Agrobacterium burrii]